MLVFECAFVNMLQENPLQPFSIEHKNKTLNVETWWPFVKKQTKGRPVKECFYVMLCYIQPQSVSSWELTF